MCVHVVNSQNFSNIHLPHYRYIVSGCVDVTLFGVSTVFLLIAAQNVQSLFLQAGITVSFCYWLPIMAAIMIPASWLGTPKDFW